MDLREAIDLRDRQGADKGGQRKRASQGDGPGNSLAAGGCELQIELEKASADLPAGFRAGTRAGTA